MHSSRQSQNAVYVLTEFALDIMKTLDNFNNDNFKSEGMLRIGQFFGKKIENDASYITLIFQEYHMAKLWQEL